MAPNRKTLDVLVQSLSGNDLAGLQSSVQPKYLPLTQEQGSAQTEAATPSTATPQGESFSYWEWNETVEEPATCILSTENIVSNLIQAAATLEETETSEQPEHDDYCAEETHRDSVTKPQHVIESSYWDWPADQDTAQADVDRVMAEEKAYQLVSGATLQANEQRHAAPHVSSDSYWTWKSEAEQQDASDYWTWPTESAEETQAREKQAFIDGLIEYEAARQLLKATTIVQQLQRSASLAPQETNIADDWEQDMDQYWDMPAFTAKRPVTVGGYWDW